MPPTDKLQEIPYGTKVAEDGCHLIDNQAELRVLTEAANLLVEDKPLSGIAAELNRLGYRTRRGDLWTQTDVFNLVPRMIDSGARLFEREAKAS